MRSQGDATPTPSPHFGPAALPGKAVVWPAAQAAVCPGPEAVEGSQQSWPGVKPAEPRVIDPPPAEGQVTDGTNAVIPQAIEAPVGIALIAVEPSPCMLNCPSN